MRTTPLPLVVALVSCQFPVDTKTTPTTDASDFEPPMDPTTTPPMIPPTSGDTGTLSTGTVPTGSGDTGSSETGDAETGDTGTVVAPMPAPDSSDTGAAALRRGLSPLPRPS